jgi:hypothetical protein
MKLYKEEQIKELSSLLKLGTESFKTFKFSYYEDTPDPESKLSPRKNMVIIHNIARYTQTGLTATAKICF